MYRLVSLRAPHLVAVLVGEDPASSVYINNKTKAAQKCGINATTKKMSKDTLEQELLDLVDKLNKDKEVSNFGHTNPVSCRWSLYTSIYGSTRHAFALMTRNYCECAHK